jgi:shikimate 5-dehydrogenase
MLICQAIESFNIWTSAAVSTSSIYGEVLNKLEGEK